MTTALIVSIILILVVILYYYISSRKNSHVPKSNQQNNSSAQELYNEQKFGPESQKLTLQERIELSWEFLYEITDIILNKFSSMDQKEINNAGRSLINNGAKYEHMVDINLKSSISKSRNLGKGQDIRM